MSSLMLWRDHGRRSISMTQPWSWMVIKAERAPLGARSIRVVKVGPYDRTLAMSPISPTLATGRNSVCRF